MPNLDTRFDGGLDLFVEIESTGATGKSAYEVWVDLGNMEPNKTLSIVLKDLLVNKVYLEPTVRMVQTVSTVKMDYQLTKFG